MNKAITIDSIVEVARVLQEYKNQVVFVGGAVVSLYADDPVASEIRPTRDIDIPARQNAFWWSSTDASSNKSWCRNLLSISTKSVKMIERNTCGFSVRCVRD